MPKSNIASLDAIIERLPFYGVQAGQTIGVLSSKSPQEDVIVEALEQFGCQCLLLDPAEGIENIAAKVESAGVKLIFALTELTHIAARLRICVAYVEELRLELIKNYN